jgi:hypothetical protein
VEADMPVSTRDAWTRDVWTRAEAGGRPSPVRNVIDRLSAVLAPDPVVHVDNGLADDRTARGLTGRLCVFTERFVAVADAVGVAPKHGQGSTGGGTVTVVVAARTSLVRIDMAPGPGGVNTAGAWSGEDARDRWPSASQVGLVYAGLGTGPLLLPTADQDTFAAFLPRLVDDLGRGGHDRPPSFDR